MKVVIVGFVTVLTSLGLVELTSPFSLQEIALRLTSQFGVVLMLAGWLGVVEEDNKTHR